MKQIGYAKLGRCMEFDETKFGFQGDAEAPQLLRRLAERNPDVWWYIVGKNDRHTDNLPQRVTNLWPDKSETWFKNGPVQHISSVKPDRMSSMLPLSDSYVINDIRSYEYQNRITDQISCLDGLIIHVGQHGTCSMPVPMINQTWDDFRVDKEKYGTNPQAWTRNYETYLVDGLNQLCDDHKGRIPIVWIVTDPRNYVKTRSIKWPTGLDHILSQYRFSRKQRHERFEDPRTPAELGLSHIAKREESGLWTATHSYDYADIELMILPDDWQSWGSAPYHERQQIGVATTSFNVGKTRRSQYVKEYILDAFPDAEIFGKWDAVSLDDIAPRGVIKNNPCDFPDLLQRWKCTIALPPLDTGWTAAKPWQCFAANTVCFFIDKLDSQGWQLPTNIRQDGLHKVGVVNGRTFYSIRDDWTEDDIVLASWLRVHVPRDVTERSHVIEHDVYLYQWIIDAQRDLLRRRWDAKLTETTIESMLGLNDE